MLKMLKIGCFKQKSLYLRYASRYSHAIFLLNSGESQVTVTSFTKIHSGLL